MSYNLATNSEYDYETNTVTIPISVLSRVGARDFPIGDFRDLVNALRTPLPDISRVYFNEPYTIIVWADGTKTIVKCSDKDFYNRDTGFAMCSLKKILGEEAYSKWKQTANRVCYGKRLEPRRGNGIWNYFYRSDDDE